MNDAYDLLIGSIAGAITGIQLYGLTSFLDLFTMTVLGFLLFGQVGEWVKRLSRDERVTTDER